MRTTVRIVLLLLFSSPVWSLPQQAGELVPSRGSVFGSATGFDRPQLLTNVELLEYFCEEHQIPWPLGAKVSTCAGKWDERPEPWKFNLRSSRSWLAYDSWNESRISASYSVSDKWVVPSIDTTERCYVWLSMCDWRTGLVVVISIGTHFTRLLRFLPSHAALVPVPIHMVAMRRSDEHSTNQNISILVERDYDGRRGYMACEIPHYLVKSPMSIVYRMVDMPYSLLGPHEANLLDRILSFVPNAHLTMK